MRGVNKVLELEENMKIIKSYQHKIQELGESL